MTEEIKEILESSRKIIKSNRENGFDRIIMLGDDIDKLLDYITNLQKEIKEANDSITWWTNRFNALRKENERLRTELNGYKSKNEKAIESIEDCKKVNGDKYTYIIDHNYLLNILEGGDE